MTEKRRILLKILLIFGISFLVLEIVMNILGLRKEVFASRVFMGERILFCALPVFASMRC